MAAGRVLMVGAAVTVGRAVKVNGREGAGENEWYAGALWKLGVVCTLMLGRPGPLKAVTSACTGTASASCLVRETGREWASVLALASRLPIARTATAKNLIVVGLVKMRAQRFTAAPTLERTVFYLPTYLATVLAEMPIALPMA